MLHPPMPVGLAEMKQIFGNHTKVGNTIMGKKGTKKFTDPMGYNTLRGGRGSLDSSGGAGTYAKPSVDHSGPNPGPLVGASSGAPGQNLRSPKKAGVMSGNPNKKG